MSFALYTLSPGKHHAKAYLYIYAEFFVFKLMERNLVFKAARHLISVFARQKREYDKKFVFPPARKHIFVP
jgi:hypothetical protein